ncbi:hypothetical protein CEH05_07550 [Halobacillus halophilus]|uniref:Secreted protein n=2 Tax=Halobacillus halophilus TaxID=1570 RepID=I0JL28_HALH3|nr:hypothetical protein [Halobacillus halophilus]ASF38973.1 hypothetical protein CEH05_07550 [Halobacillus halophilus]CCG44848.1 hypothetical protein HBHAL_2504 [Halobacillus halophilus DSM 2266]
MKKLRIIALTFFIALFVPTSAFAITDDVTPLGPGEWDTLYYNNVYLTSSYKEIQVNSGGGNLEICVFNMNPSNNGNFRIQEQDPSGREFVGFGYIYPDSNGDFCHVITDLNPYVDGSNNKAEFVIGFDANGFNETVTIRVRD